MEELVESLELIATHFVRNIDELGIVSILIGVSVSMFGIVYTLLALLPSLIFGKPIFEKNGKIIQEQQEIVKNVRKHFKSIRNCGNLFLAALIMLIIYLFLADIYLKSFLFILSALSLILGFIRIIIYSPKILSSYINFKNR